ncbi:MAG: CarD family transcriptional regulator [Clostridia bacterium]|nr:CarD family transcriptional regulator [Clostridia bacterium]
MYAVGDKIVYPMHGMGYIEKIENKQIGEKCADYYTIHIINGNIKLCLPVECKAEIRLRPITKKEEAQRILSDFETQEIDSNITWNKRYQYNMDRLKKGDMESVAQVVRELMTRDVTNGLSTGDRKMLILSRGILVTEMAIVLDWDEQALAEHLMSVIRNKLEQK